MPAQGATSEARKISFDYVGGTDRHLNLPLDASTNVQQLRIAAQSAAATPLLVTGDGIPSRIVDLWLAETLSKLADAAPLLVTDAGMPPRIVDSWLADALPELAAATPLLVTGDGIPSRIVDSWLAEALSELADAGLEAEEEGYPQPGDFARAQAERILRQLAVTDPAGSSPAVSPTADGDIAISFHNPEIEGIVQILCEQGGGAAVYSTIAGKSRYTCYDAASAHDLPDTTLKGELAKLKPA